MTHCKILLAFLINLILFSQSLSGQQKSSRIIVLDSFTAKNISVEICGLPHHHPVDIKAKLIIDSLKSIGIDTVLIYRHWLGVNGVNGYGKVLWYDKGLLKQFRINYINHKPFIGIKSVDFSVLTTDSIFSFYLDNKTEFAKDNPTKKNIYVSHDADHFIYVEINGNVCCYNLEGLVIEANQQHFRSRLINRLSIDTRQYIKEIYND